MVIDVVVIEPGPRFGHPDLVDCCFMTFCPPTWVVLVNPPVLPVTTSSIVIFYHKGFSCCLNSWSLMLSSWFLISSSSSWPLVPTRLIVVFILILLLPAESCSDPPVFPVTTIVMWWSRREDFLGLKFLMMLDDVVVMPDLRFGRHPSWLVAVLLVPPGEAECSVGQVREQGGVSAWFVALLLGTIV